MKSKNICRLGCMLVLSCLVLNSYADEPKNPALSALKAFASEISHTVQTSLDIINQTTKYIADNQKILKNVIRKIENGETLTDKENKTLGIERIKVNYNHYKIIWEDPLYESLNKCKPTELFSLQHTIYIHNKKAYLDPNFVVDYDTSNKSINIKETKIRKNEEFILGVQLPTEIEIKINYSFLFKDSSYSENIKNREILMRISANSAKPKILSTSGDFSLERSWGLVKNYSF